MSTNELENKLKIIKDAGIHCPTLELAKKVLDIFHKLGLKWCSDVSYIKCTNWDSYENNTVYYPFEGRFSSLAYAQQINCKIISAEEFITLHTEEFNLENYEPKGDLVGFPKEIIARMLYCQQEQGNKRDVSVFERDKSYTLGLGGFRWVETEEGGWFWYEVIKERNFSLFFEKYPKKEDNSQEFRVGDKVIDIITGRIGKVISINTLTKDSYPISVEFDDNEVISFTLDGRDYNRDKYQRLLHYRDDYDYSVIDFNNLPKRQEVKRWRAEKREKYYYFNTYFEVHSFIEEYSNTDTKLYDSGDYFRTEEQAQEAANKLKKYFKQLIKEEQEHEKN